MHGVPAHNTNGLRANFAGSDIIIDTQDPRIKRLVQVKTGYSPAEGQIYLTQASGEPDLVEDKFKADFVVFVNIDKKIGEAHQHRGTLSFEHLVYYVVPVEVANQVYRAAVQREYERPLIKSTKKRSLSNMAVNVQPHVLAEYRDAWHLLRCDPV